MTGPRLKAFPSDTLIVVPLTWKLALEIPYQHIQANVVAFAASKAEVIQILTDRLAGNDYAARQMARFLHLRRDTLNNYEEALITAGLIDPARSGVYAYRDHGNVIELLPGGEPALIGRLSYDPEQMGVVRAEPAQ